MALNKVNYVDNQTVITAQNLNNIQNEIIQNTELIKKVAPRNLLNNSDFRDPVNQLGIISGTEVKPYAIFIDGWRNGEESSIAPNLSSNGIQPNGAIFQVLDLSAYISKKMTLAVGFSDGNVVIASGTLTEASAEQKLQLIFGTMEMGIATLSGMWLAGINYPNSIIQWAALYEGEYTTETLPEYQPKGYMVEALNCGALHVTTTATLNEGQWSNSAPFEQSIVIPGIIESDVPHITPVYSTTNTTAIAQKEAWACVSNAIAENGVIRFICFEDKPTTTIPIQIEVNR